MKFIVPLLFIAIYFIGCQEKTVEKIQNEIVSEKQPKDNLPTLETDTLIHSNKYLVLGNRGASVRIVDKSDSLNYKDYKVIDYTFDKLVVAKDLIESSFEIYRKSNSEFNFNHSKVEIFHGKLADPDFEASPKARRYITRITEDCKKGINFAGKYTLVTWGCGSNCQGGAIVDRTNGKIYDGYFSTYGSEFQADSNYIIFNSGLIDKETGLISFHTIVDVRYQYWNGSEFKDI